MPKPAAPIDLGSWILLAILSVLWGGSYLFAGVAIRELPPLVIVLARVVLAAAALVPIHLMLQGPLPRDARTWANFAAMSLFNNIAPFILFISGLAYIPSGLGSVINATTPLFTVAIMAAFGEEALNLRRIVGLMTGLLGVMVIQGAGMPDLGRPTIGLLLCLVAALSYGFAALWARRRLKDVAPLTSATCQLVCSSLFIVPLAFQFSTPSRLLSASPQVWASLGGLALLSTALAYFVFFRIVTRTGASAVMLVTMMIPVPAILLGNLILGEALEPRQIAGAAIIGAALLIIDGRLLSYLGRRKTATGER